ncbi:hypothetical protein ACFE04_020501 [Oxalis oulophora]
MSNSSIEESSSSSSTQVSSATAVLLGALAPGVNGPTWNTIKSAFLLLSLSLALMLALAFSSSDSSLLLHIGFLIFITATLFVLLTWFLAETGLVSVEHQMREMDLKGGGRIIYPWQKKSLGPANATSQALSHSDLELPMIQMDEIACLSMYRDRVQRFNQRFSGERGKQDRRQTQDRLDQPANSKHEFYPFGSKETMAEGKAPCSSIFSYLSRNVGAFQKSLKLKETPLPAIIVKLFLPNFKALNVVSIGGGS